MKLKERQSRWLMRSELEQFLPKKRRLTRRIAMESLAQIERTECLTESSGRQEIVLKHVPETDELSKGAMVETRLGGRLEVRESKLKSNNEQNMVRVLEKLLECERRARIEALSVLLEASQGKCDMLVQELTAIRHNETALEGKLRTAFHGKRVRSYEMGMESIQDIGTSEEVGRGNKRSKNTNSPLKFNTIEDGGSAERVEVEILSQKTNS